MSGEGGVLRYGHGARSGDPGLGQHPFWSRAVRALRLPRANQLARKRLTLVHKTNVLTFAGDLWQRS